MKRRHWLLLLALASCTEPETSPSFSGSVNHPRAVVYWANSDAGIQYVYDPVGRLVGVITPTGDLAQYVYDPAGNITAINRDDSGVLAVVGFNQNNLAAGQSLTIFGSGFSTTSANNTVTINGVAATVTSASEGQLTVTVPSGTDGGTLKVVVGTKSATGSSPLEVGYTSPPTITSFSPDAGLPDASITITGTGFDPNPNNDLVFVNQEQATVLTASATSLVVAVPQYAVSGKVTVETVNGSAVSANDFWIPPPGYVVSQIVGAGRVTLDGGYLTVPTDAGTASLVLFDGTEAEQAVGFSFNNSTSSAYYYVLDPQGTQLESALVYSTYTQVVYNDVVFLPGTGTYEIALESFGSTAGSTGVQIAPMVASSISSDGGQFTFTGTSDSSVGIMTFLIDAGDNFSVVMGASFSVDAYLYDANNLVSGLASTEYSPTEVMDVRNAPVSGTYTLLLEPAGATGQVSVNVLIDATGSLAADGGVFAGSLVAGQRGDYAFTGTSGQFLGLGMSSLVTDPTDTSVTATIEFPLGTTLWTTSATSPGTNLQFGPLPDAGTYYVRIEPFEATSATFDLDLLAPITGLLTPGIHHTFTVSEVGLESRYTFSGTANANMSLIASGSTFSDAAFISVLDPSGNVIAQDYVYSSGPTVLDLLNLPSTGTYTVIVDPYGTDTGHVTLTLYSDLTGQIPIDGGSTSITLAAGQRGDYTFTGTQGAYVGFGLPSITTTPSAQSTTFKLSNIVGTLSAFSLSSAGDQELPSLPDSGVYTLRVEPSNGAAATLSVDLPPSVSCGALPTDGGIAPMTTVDVGQPAIFTFSATAGPANHTLNVTGSTYTGVTMYVYGPDSSLFTDGTVTGATGSLSFSNIPVTGTYTVNVVPSGTSTGTLSLSLN